jgi:hypothetical protein
LPDLLGAGSLLSAQMEFPFSLEGFAKRRLSVRLPGLLKGTRLIVDGVEQTATKGRYQVIDDFDRTRQVVLKHSIFDGLPSVQIDGEKSTPIAPKLKWYEQVWSALPFGLIAIGGALGGGLGFVGLSLNTRIFRTKEGPARYLFSAVVTLLTFATYIAGATLIRGAIQSE